MPTEDTIPKGYMQRADGTLVPAEKVKPVDKDRDQVVRDLCKAAQQASADLLAFKLTAMEQVNAFVARSLADYGASWGGKKGNVTLTSYDGAWQVVLQVQESIAFGEQLQAAKVLIDQCTRRWLKGSNANIKALIDRAFVVDKAGLISTGRVLALRSLKIDDPEWLQAMQAITDSMTVVSSKNYLRFYRRVESGEYVAIPLDVAGV